MSLKISFALLIFGCALLGLGDAWRCGVGLESDSTLSSDQGGADSNAYPVDVYPGGAGYPRQLTVAPSYAGYPGLVYPVSTGYQEENIYTVYVYPSDAGYQGGNGYPGLIYPGDSGYLGKARNPVHVYAGDAGYLGGTGTLAD